MNYKKLLPKRQQNSHKGTFGKVLNIAGSEKYQGAAYLSSISALKIGAGYVAWACPESVTNHITALTPDITFLPLTDSLLQNIQIIKDNLNRFDVISVGCGLGTDKRTLVFFDKLIDLFKKVDLPVIIDADGLNAISILGISKLPKATIITPHEAELSRMLGASVQEIAKNRVAFAKEASQKYNCVTVLKGHGAVICDKQQNITINKTGNSALAKAGTGDVLTGIITGLVAQGCSLKDAACLGVYLHGLSGYLASKELTEYSVLASDLIKFIPKAVNKTL